MSHDHRPGTPSVDVVCTIFANLNQDRLCDSLGQISQAMPRLCCRRYEKSLRASPPVPVKPHGKRFTGNNFLPLQFIIPPGHCKRQIGKSNAANFQNRGKNDRFAVPRNPLLHSRFIRFLQVLSDSDHTLNSCQRRNRSEVSRWKHVASTWGLCLQIIQRFTLSCSC